MNVADPEALHALLGRCAGIVEQHGGTVERYLGEALVGFFGLTQSHGDDALRAARAAVQLRASLADVRLGLELGQVFLAAGPRDATSATGAAISAAGRLAERAAEGEILLGDDIRRAVAADASIDRESGRLLELRPDEPALLRAAATPFVGRARELGELHAALARATDDRVCRLVTVAGPPGIGKSRLAHEFLDAVGDDATVLAGRCLAYGEGTTYRALLDIVRAAHADIAVRFGDVAEDEQVQRIVRSAIGLSDQPVQMEEISWALRRLLERLGRERPVVVAVEDIHWADAPLLDLLDHIVTLSSGAPILIVCLTRPELMDLRPTWAAPQPNRRVLMLDALPDAEARELAERLGAQALAPRIAERAEGNPLFIEQLVAVGDRDQRGELPVTVQAVLAARIDRLDAGERMLLQHAAVEGRTFHVGALGTLATTCSGSWSPTTLPFASGPPWSAIADGQRLEDRMIRMHPAIRWLGRRRTHRLIGPLTAALLACMLPALAAPAAHAANYAPFGVKDWDRDGHQDLIVRDNAATSLWMLPGRSVRTFSPARPARRSATAGTASRPSAPPTGTATVTRTSSPARTPPAISGWFPVGACVRSPAWRAC